MQSSIMWVMLIRVLILVVITCFPAYADSDQLLSDNELESMVGMMMDARYAEDDWCLDYSDNLENIKNEVRKKLVSIDPEDSEFFLEAAIMADSKQGIEKALIENPQLELEILSTALHLAAEYSEPETLSYLVSLNLISLDANLFVDIVHTPIDAAISHSRRRNVDVLLNAGADINMGYPLLHTSLCKDKKMFEYLIERGARLDDLSRKIGKKIGIELDD